MLRGDFENRKRGSEHERLAFSREMVIWEGGLGSRWFEKGDKSGQHVLYTQFIVFVPFSCRPPYPMSLSRPFLTASFQHPSLGT